MQLQNEMTQEFQIIDRLISCDTNESVHKV